MLHKMYILTVSLKLGQRKEIFFKKDNTKNRNAEIRTPAHTQARFSQCGSRV